MKLPLNENKTVYEIRLESIGGLGANLCGKMLGELGGMYLNLNSVSFSGYGSEKRGAPVKAHIRWSENEILENSPVEAPDILCIFHDALIQNKEIFYGIRKTTKIIISTGDKPIDIIKKANLKCGKLYCIDALKISMKEKSRINMVMLGAIVKACGFIDLSEASRLTSDTVGKKYPALTKSNLAGLEAGYNNLKEEISAGEKEEPYQKKAPVIYGYKNTLFGGINTVIGSTVTNSLKASREGYIPLFIKEKCINCGMCDVTCPDMVFRFEKGTYKKKNMMINTGLDYEHCKGCMRCVEICPTEALVSGPEREHPTPLYNTINKDLIDVNFSYDEKGADSWITSESYLTEKRIDGGAV